MLKLYFFFLINLWLGFCKVCKVYFLLKNSTENLCSRNVSVSLKRFEILKSTAPCSSPERMWKIEMWWNFNVSCWITSRWGGSGAETPGLWWRFSDYCGSPRGNTFSFIWLNVSALETLSLQFLWTQRNPSCQKC